MKIGSLKEFKDFFPIVVDIPVAWGEMDSMQHVNHTVYLKWMETARFEFFEKLGMTDLIEETGVGNILKSIKCRYRIPLTHPDTVSVGAKLS
ncbi:MAG: acyl-CoA thioesterase, partial [SAR324 cluster bacterium]|nr:acyl-CoA thioesterase [SAR324 cluster bacterium]